MHLTGGRLAERDLVRHQRNMISLSDVLGYASPADLPFANAIFARSCRLATLAEESKVGVWEWWKACWPVHQQLLEIVRPEVIITLGYGKHTSPLGFLAHDLKAGEPCRVGDANRRGGRRIDCTIPLVTSTLDVSIIGVPHPSYYAPGPELASLLRTIASLANS